TLASSSEVAGDIIDLSPSKLTSYRRTVALYWLYNLVQFAVVRWTTFGDAAMQSGWGAFYGWRVDRQSAIPLTRQIYMQVRSAVLAGALGPGAELPSSRAMATSLGVARGSVVAAYEQLAIEGYVESWPGSGTFVSRDLAGRIEGSRRPSAARSQ